MGLRKRSLGELKLTHLSGNLDVSFACHNHKCASICHRRLCLNSLGLGILGHIGLYLDSQSTRPDLGICGHDAIGGIGRAEMTSIWACLTGTSFNS